jgi:hypothetical protein
LAGGKESSSSSSADSDGSAFTLATVARGWNFCETTMPRTAKSIAIDNANTAAASRMSKPLQQSAAPAAKRAVPLDAFSRSNAAVINEATRRQSQDFAEVAAVF